MITALKNSNFNVFHWLLKTIITETLYFNTVLIKKIIQLSQFSIDPRLFLNINFGAPKITISA